MSWDLSNDVASGFDAIPAGQYIVCARKAEVQKTKTGTGEYVKVEFEILSGEYRGRKLWSQFNVKNDNPKAVEIGRGQMKSFFVAAGLTPEQIKKVDTASFIGQTAVANVKVEKDETYGDKNVITSFKSEKATVVTSATATPSVTRPGF